MVAADGTAIAENDHLGVYRMARDQLADARRHLSAVSGDVAEEVPGDPVSVNHDRAGLRARFGGMALDIPGAVSPRR